MSNFLDGKAVNISKINEEIFLKYFSRDFHQKIIDPKDLNTLDNTLSEWIENIDDYNTKRILELMQTHKENEFWFSSIIGFFYQYGIGCDVDNNKAMKLYLLAVNNESLNRKFTNLRLFEENDNEFVMFQNINIVIGKYLLSLF